MTAPEDKDHMSDEPFLERWSRRKRDAGRERGAGGPDAAVSRSGPVAPDAAAVPETAPASDPPFDVASLPPVESIGPATDIRDFLKPGVPAELTRAALRRAWSVDPAVRDYIGPAENAWDFNDPTAMAGFGALEAGEAQRLLAGLPGGAPSASAADTAAKIAAGEPAEVEAVPRDAPLEPRPDSGGPATSRDDSEPQAMAARQQTPSPAPAGPADIASQQSEQAEQQTLAQARRGRSRGGALPQ